MNGNIIKSFLVGLGFGVDDASLKKFNDSIKSASLRVTALYGSIKIAAAGIFWSISKISEGFEEMGYEFRLIAPAINKTLILRNEMLKAYAAAGINIQKVVQQSVRFNMSLTKTKYALEAIYKSVGAKFFPMLTKQMDIFRKNIYANMPKIQAALEKFINFIFKAFEATTILGARIWSILQRVYDFFYKLHQETSGWSTMILAAIAAWKLLNLSFLATPFGMLITGLVALLALWDDFKTFKEGGESLINWGSDTTKMMVGIGIAIAGVVAAIYTAIYAMKTIQAVSTAFTATMAFLDGVMKALRLTWLGINLVMSLNPLTLWIVAATALVGILGVLIWKWDAIKEGVLGFFSGVGSKVMDFMGGASNIGQTLANGLGGAGAAPLGANIANSNQTNQNVNQQTQINVTGTSDANSVGKAVAGEQGRVNFDMVRNMKGATR